MLLARAITLVESARPEHQSLARTALDTLLADQAAQASFRIGISGAPGVGKSTFIESFGLHLINKGHRVAVLAVDPSSALSKGSILGDKTRMEKLSVRDEAFIRPSPAGDSLGGVARKTRETILLVEAAGYDTILIETVGVGQSEVTVHGMCDAFVLLLQPGAGDELQGIKRGIVEMADLLVVNKADGDREKAANQTRAHYWNAAHLLPPKASGWTPEVLLCSALEAQGIADIWDALERYRQQTSENGFYDKNRTLQAKKWFREALMDGLTAHFFATPGVQQLLAELEPQVENQLISAYSAAERMIRFWAGEKWY